MEAVKGIVNGVSTETWMIALVVVVFAILIFTYKIPIICYGCESPEGVSKYIFRCINDTAKDSEMCKISKNIDLLKKDISDQTSLITNAVLREITVELPDSIRVAIKKIIDQVSSIVAKIMEGVSEIRDKILGFISKAFEEVKNVVITSAEEFYKIIIQPIIDFINLLIISPITMLIQKLVEFKELVATSIEVSVKEVSGIGIKLKNEINGAIVKIPKSIEKFINIIVDLVNTTVGGTVDGMNDATYGITQGVNTSLTGVTSGVSAGINGLSTGINKSVIFGINETTKGTVGGINTSLSGIGEAINKGVIDNVNRTTIGTVKGVNSGFTGVTNGVNASVETLTSGVEKSVNGSIQVINTATGGLKDGVNGAVTPLANVLNDVIGGYGGIRDWNLKLQTPELAVLFGVGRVPGITIIDAKPLQGLPGIGKVDYKGVDFQKVGDVTINRPPGIVAPAIKIPDEIPGVSIKGIAQPEPIKEIPEFVLPGPPGGQYINSVKELIKKPTPIPQVNMDNATADLGRALETPYVAASAAINTAYDKAMEPINIAIVTLTGLASAIKDGISTLFQKFLSMDYLYTAIATLQDGISLTVSKALEIVKARIVTPVMNIVNLVIYKVIQGVNEVIATLREVFMDMIAKLSDAFKVVADALFVIAKTVTKAVGYGAFFTLATLTDILIPLNISKSSKMNLALLACTAPTWPYLVSIVVNIKYIAYIAIAVVIFATTIALTMSVPPPVTEDPVKN
jgi:phage-related protein